MLSLSSRAAIVGACLCWSLGTILSKTLLTSFSPVTVLVFQLAPSVIALWSLAILSRSPVPPVRMIALIGLLGLLNPGLAYTLSMLGLAETSASVTTLLWAFEPILILGLAWAFLAERIDRRLVGLVIVATCGVLLVSDGSTFRANMSSALILAGVLCCALYSIVARNLIADPLFTIALQQSVALVWVVAIWPLELRSAGLPNIASVSPKDFGTLIISGLLYYALAYWLYLRALWAMPASVAGSFLNLIPVFGVFGSFVFLDESLTLLQWFGAALIVGTAIAVMWRKVEPTPRTFYKRASRPHRPLTMLDEHQLDDLGLTPEMARKLSLRKLDKS
ncbi:DMT family transporter [Ensifer adhaerens]|uniref:DMT family transporter n=1 Tax=Ensifer adhaerens TaxID=106592 RepID=A0A9Q8YJM6_ENSAD|nr:DMT family transporter [Ensifer adhaerens]USJ28634.1 DMT family transporter [Ensifer adhaerens]